MSKIKWVLIILIIFALMIPLSLGGSIRAQGPTDTPTPTPTPDPNIFTVSVSPDLSSFPLFIANFGGADQFSTITVPNGCGGSADWIGVIIGTRLTKTADAGDGTLQRLGEELYGGLFSTFSYWLPVTISLRVGSNVIGVDSDNTYVAFNPPTMTGATAISYAQWQWGSNWNTTAFNVNPSSPTLVYHLAHGLNNWNEGYGSVLSISDICYGAAVPTDTPAPTPTPTPLPNPPDQSGTLFGSCQLLGDQNATFYQMPGLWDVFGDVVNPPGTTNGALVEVGTGFTGNGGNVSQSVFLDPVGSYKITLHYHITSLEFGQYFRVFLGNNSPFLVPITSTLAPQTWESPFSNFAPDSQNSSAYTFKLSFSVEDPDNHNPGLVWDYACISRSPNDTSGHTDPIITDCKTCTYQPIGGLGGLPEDIVKLFQWLMCGLRQLVVCFLASFLNGIWKGIVDVITFIAFIRLWLSIVVDRAIQWLGNTARVLWAFFGGALQIVIQSPINAAIQLFNRLGIANVINSVIAWLGGALQSVFNFLRVLVPTVVGIVGGILSIIFFWIGTYISLLGQILWSIPVFINSLIQGINATPTDIPIYAPTCTNEANLLFWPCLGSYVLDLTIFEGPIYLFIIIALGALAFDVAIWAVVTIREALSK